MNEPSLAERARYAFDNTLSRDPIALIGWLALVSVAVILVVAVIVTLAGIAPEGSSRLGLAEAAWMSLMRTLDSGTMGGDLGWGFRFAMLAVTLGGIFVISTLIGVLTSGIEEKLGAMRKGRSRVIESNHTVILGWSQQIFSILSELVIANANQRRPSIVVLADRDKVEMEDEIRDQVGATGRTRIVCRTGSPIELSDLEIVGMRAARSIILLAPEVDDPDSNVIKTILAITNSPDRRPMPYHIVAEIRDSRNLEVARMVGRDEVELVLVGNLVSRIIAQTCRQSGLSVVYTELLDFGGDEIYFKAEPALTGQTFGEALLAYEDSAVIGLRPQGGSPQLNPPMETRLQDSDQLIAISEDDDTIRLSGITELNIPEAAIRFRQAMSPAPERTLLLGWNWRAPSLINELDHYVAPGSEVAVLADHPGGEEEIARECAGVKNQTVHVRQGDTTDRRALDDLGVETYDHVILLCYSDTLEAQQADARTLVTLLHLRDIADRGGYDFSIVSEMLDVRNRALAEVTRADDFIVSDRIVSLMLSQVSENKQLNAVFADLFDPGSSEIYLKPASEYVALGEPVNFYTVVESARRRGQVAFGFRLGAESGDPAKSYGVRLNPDKSAAITFAEGDKVVVLAEE